MIQFLFILRCTIECTVAKVERILIPFEVHLIQCLHSLCTSHKFVKDLMHEWNLRYEMLLCSKRFKYANLPLSLCSQYSVSYRHSLIFLPVVPDPDEKAFFDILIFAGLSSFPFQNNSRICELLNRSCIFFPSRQCRLL